MGLASAAYSASASFRRTAYRRALRPRAARLLGSVKRRIEQARELASHATPEG
jgi:hypothetical protein